MEDISQQKKALRQQMKQLRDSISEKERHRKSERICASIIQHVLQPIKRRQDESSLLTYMPIRSEVDVTSLLKWGWANRFHVLLPKVVESTNHLQLHVVKSMDDLAPGTWGIVEPIEGTMEWTSPVDVMIVPGLAFDPYGGRLGYGGGYYDRLWAKWQEGKQPLKIAAAYEEQIIPRVPCEIHDMRVDIVVTEGNRYQARK